MAEGKAFGKNEFVEALAKKADLSKKDAHKVLNVFTDTVTEELAKGNKVKLLGFGNFEVNHRAARKGRNPQTGEPIQLPASKVAHFKAGKTLKDAIK